MNKVRDLRFFVAIGLEVIPWDFKGFRLMGWTL